MTTVPLVENTPTESCVIQNSDLINNPDSIVEIPPPFENNWTASAMDKAGSSLKALQRMAKRPRVNIEFQDITYTVGSSQNELKILNSVSGECCSGEVTCILGPSGAGKSTLLNVLAGYTSNTVSGKVFVNGHNRDMNVFKKLSSYIMQDDLLQPRLSVLESMKIAADLKLGKELGEAEKELIIEEILETLGLWDHRDTRSERLSGGQTKRLSIALELVNNPPVIFLDEPTTGLDIVSVRQLVVLLRLLSRQGRTIVCTVHQPSASLFTLFDRLYILARGTCCYQGAVPLLVPFLSDVGYICPTTHNPADFVIETLVSEMEARARLSELCQNGKKCAKLDRVEQRREQEPVLPSDDSIQRVCLEQVAKDQFQKAEFPTTFSTQFKILSKRMLIQSRRNSLSLWIQLTHHIITALLVGSMFYGVGKDGNTPIVNFKFCISCLVFFMYTYSLVPVLLYPTELRVIRREYFNRWYSLKAYYAALTLSTLPTMVVFGFIFLIISYSMSGQPLEWNRFILFCISGFMIGLCSEGIGLLVGITFSVTSGSIVAPASLSPLLALCCYGMGFGPSIETRMRALMSLSYLRYGLSGLSLALYKNRSPLDCNVDFCLHANPEIILRDVGMANDVYYIQIIVLFIFTVFYRVIAYTALRYRLKSEFSSRFLTYLSKFLKHR